MKKNRIDVFYQKALAYFTGSVDGKGIDNKMLGAAVWALEKQVPKKGLRMSIGGRSARPVSAVFTVTIGTLWRKTGTVPVAGKSWNGIEENNHTVLTGKSLLGRYFYTLSEVIAWT